MLGLKKITLSLILVLTSVGALADTDEIIEKTGDVLQIALPLTALAATYTLDDPEGRKALLMSYGATFTVTHILKRTVKKVRPNGWNTLSFPSGHTSSAFSGASFLAKRYGWEVGVPAYLAASFVGYSRVHAEQHDWVDVTAGALLAVGLNQWLVPNQDDISLAIQPTKGGYQMAFSFRY